MIIPVRCFTCGKVRVLLRSTDALSVLFVFCIFSSRLVFFNYVFFVRSFGGGGDFRIENAREVERESRKNCDAMYRSIDSRNFFRRFFAMMAKKRGRIDRSIDRRRSSHTRRRRGLVLPVAWSFLEWSDAISFSLSPLKSKR